MAKKEKSTEKEIQQQAEEQQKDEKAEQQEVTSETEEQQEVTETSVEETVTQEPAAEEPAAEEKAAEDYAKTVTEDVSEEKKKDDSKGYKRVMQGKVLSNKSDKTINVLIERQVAHPIYKKYYKQSRKVLAHDENNDCNIGDVVRIKEHRPLSARKRWNLLDIVERAK